MISGSDREKAVSLIKEAHAAGASIAKACDVIGIDERTYYRWEKKQKEGSIEDGRPGAVHPTPSWALTLAERQRVLDIANSEEYADKTPHEIVVALADKGEYVASESTFYRILKEENLLNHRGRTAESGHGEATTHVATAPNQVWMWDITYLYGPAKGIYFYLYMIIDLFSRDVVDWEVWDTQDMEHSSELIRRACIKQGRLSTQPLVLHSDNGSPMKGATMLETLYALGITPSNSRPRVSNDNAYAESIFKTLKYRPNYQPKGFATIEDARSWVKGFVRWYRFEHYHSGIKFLHPADVHAGKGEAILEKRHTVYEAAKAAHPDRWHGRKTRDWSFPAKVYLNPPAKVDVHIPKKAA